MLNRGDQVVVDGILDERRLILWVHRLRDGEAQIDLASVRGICDISVPDFKDPADVCGFGDGRLCEL